MKYVIAGIAAVYLGIEIQAWLFLSELYSKPLTAETLGNYERFGYASFGLGMSVFFFRLATKEHSYKKAILALLLTPLIYVASVWSIYEVVQRSSSWISDKPKSMSASVLTLSDPGWRNAFLYYFGDPQIDEESVSILMTRYPPSERLIKASYISAIRSVSHYSDVYLKASEKLDQAVVKALIKRGTLLETDLSESAGLQKHLNATALRQAVNEQWLFNLNPWYSADYYKAMSESPQAIYDAKTYYSSRLGDIYFHTPRLLLKFSSDFGLQLEVDILDWDAKQQNFLVDTGRYKERALIAKFLGFDSAPEADLSLSGDEYFRYLVSKKLFGPLVGDNENSWPLLPWKGSKDFIDSEAFLFGASKIAPFFFKGEQTVVNFEDLMDRGTRITYIDRIRSNLTPGLKDHWVDYQHKTYLALSSNAEAWKNPTNYALNKDIVRVGAILPFMLLLSTVMILINIAIGLSGNKTMMVATASAIVLALAGSHVGIGEVLLKIILPISVSAPQIFVF